MKIEEQNIAAIQAFGYTESEARFLYIVATHSGYFIPRQFITFTGAKWGKRSTHFAEKIESRGHAAWRKYPGIGGVYHLFAKRLYGEIGKENLAAGGQARNPGGVRWSIPSTKLLTSTMRTP